jgi:CHAT domain-containing protein
VRIPVAVLVCLCCFLGTASTEDQPPRPLNPVEAGDAVTAAVAASDTAALEALARADEPDPWLVVEHLCTRGRHDEAAAFSTAAPRKAVASLPAYVAAWRARTDDESERERLGVTQTALGRREPQAVVDATDDLPSRLDNVLRIRLGHARGIALRMLRRLEEGEAALRRAAEGAVTIGWLSRAATLYAWAGRTARQRAAHDAALDAYTRALALQEDIGALAQSAATLGNMGIVHQERGDFAQALELHGKALEQKTALGDRAGAASTLMNLGSVHGQLGNYPAALRTFEQAHERLVAVGDQRGAAGTLGGIALVHQYLGDYRKALTTFAQALEQQDKLGDRRGAATTLGNMGIVHEALGDYAKAIAAHEKARSQKLALGDRAGAAQTLGNLGIVYRSLGDYPRALEIYTEARKQKLALGDKAGAARTLANIGVVHMDRREYADALAAHQEARDQLAALGDRTGEAGLLGYIATAHLLLGDHEQALATFEQALEIQTGLGDRHGAASTLAGIGRVHHELGHYELARDFYGKSTRAARSLRATRLLVAAWTSLAELHLDHDEPARALGTAQRALGAAEKLLSGLGEMQGADARARQADLYAIGALAAVREDDAPEAFAFLESGRAGALLDGLDKREGLRWKKGSITPALRRQEQEAEAAEAAARHAYDLAVRGRKFQEVKATSQALEEARAVVQEVAGRIQRFLHRELEQQAGLFYPRAKPIEEIAAALRTDQALVLYGICKNEAVALVVRKNGERVVALGSLADVTAACQALDASNVDVDPTNALAALRRLLVQPLGLPTDVRQVLVSPEGVLCYLPFGALFDQPVALPPSGTTHLLLLGEERSRGKGILAVGAPDYGGASEQAQAIYYRGRPLLALPASRAEVEAIGTVTLLGADASEARFRDALPAEKRWRAIHFACHGLVNTEHPMLSSLALSRTGDDDGFFTALQILRTRIPTDLTVLSACETGTGEIAGGEGIVGLMRAFMFAGSPRVICSLWKVHDEATRALMMKFYELWNPKTGTGMSAAAALQQAQAHIRAQEKWSHPYYWAAWVLWGLPD